MNGVAADGLQIENLSVNFMSRGATMSAVNEVSLQISAGECVGIVGESGSGKTQLFLSAMRLLPANARVSGRVLFRGKDLLTLEAAALNRIRGVELAMVFQDPMTALTPHLKIGVQLREVLWAHQPMDRRTATALAMQMLERVQIANAAQRLQQYPHELSGGMRQRVMIAMACLCRPAMLIADEPTTALDVTVQAQIMQLLRELRTELGTAIALISHDFALVANMAERIVVMYAGRIVEVAATARLLSEPAHPYTRGLLHSVLHWQGPRLARLPHISGQPPTSNEVRSGCDFAPRCSKVQPLCLRTRPALTRVDQQHDVACHFPGGL